MTEKPTILEASNGREGIELFKMEKPPMVIMDIVMPEMNGLSAARQIWAENPAAKILFWSQFHREAYVRELGKIVPDEAIHGYALKSESDDKLKHALVSVFVHNNPYIDPVVRNQRNRISSKEHTLTDAEYESLVDIALGLTDKAIAQRRCISVRGVQNRLASLLNKLIKRENWALQKTAGMEVYNPRTRIVFEAMKCGFLTVEELVQFEVDLDEWVESELDCPKQLDS
jgi:DNA-binding NarL/FixJ family response regulator